MFPKENCAEPASNCHQPHVCFKGTVNDCQKCWQDTDQRFTWLLKRYQQTNLTILMMMLVITHTLTANGPCLDEQQAALLSGYRNDEFNQDLHWKLSYVPFFRLAHLWPLTMITLRSPAQYQGQQRSPWTRSTGKRVQNEPNDRQSELVGQSKISWGTPTN